MRHPCAAILSLFLATVAIVPAISSAQEDGAENSRKVMNRVAPAYPPLARHTNIKGSVRMEALVAPNGTIKSLEVKGGNPVLVEAAETAIRKWKWEPASRETREPIEVRFEPR